MLFYKNFDTICRNQGTSASAAAKAIGRSKGASSAWKKNGTLPKEDELIALARHLNCKVADFFAEGQPIYSSFEQAMNAKLASGEWEIASSSTQEEGVSDFAEVYRECSKRQRSELMTLVYQFAEDQGFEL